LGPFGRFTLSGARCRSSVVEHSIGNGEVDSSILSGSTISPNEIKDLEDTRRKTRVQPLLEKRYSGRNIHTFFHTSVVRHPCFVAPNSDCRYPNTNDPSTALARRWRGSLCLGQKTTADEINPYRCERCCT
jgi:hypothetical protein